MTPPIVVTRDLKELTENMLDSSRLDVALPILEQNMMNLAPAALVAHCLLKELPEVHQREAVRILIVGGDLNDCSFNGVFYQLVADMIGNPKLRIHVTAVGPDLAEPDKAPAPTVLPGFRDRFPFSLGLFIESLGAAKIQDLFDVAFLFHPGFESHWRSWLLDDDSLPQLIQSGIPVIGTSYEEAELEVDQEILEHFGVSIAESWQNPFAFVLEEVHVTWGASVWKFDSKVETRTWEIDPEEIDSIRVPIPEEFTQLIEEFSRVLEADFPENRHLSD